MSSDSSTWEQLFTAALPALSALGVDGTAIQNAIGSAPDPSMLQWRTDLKLSALDATLTVSARSGAIPLADAGTYVRFDLDVPVPFLGDRHVALNAALKRAGGDGTYRLTVFDDATFSYRSLPVPPSGLQAAVTAAFDAYWQQVSPFGGLTAVRARGSRTLDVGDSFVGPASLIVIVYVVLIVLCIDAITDPDFWGAP